jgi:hypothetical protein
MTADNSPLAIATRGKHHAEVEAKRLSAELADSQAECAYLKGELDRYQGAYLDEHGKAETCDEESEHWHQEYERLIGIVKSTEGALTDAGCVVTGDPSDHPGLVRLVTAECERLRADAEQLRNIESMFEAVGHDLTEVLERMSEAGTPAPRPPRDESVPPPGIFIEECGSGYDWSFDFDRWHQGPAFRTPAGAIAAAWAALRAHGYAPAPPDHGAFLVAALQEVDGFVAEALSTYNAPERYELLTMCRVRITEALCSPVTRSEPTALAAMQAERDAWKASYIRPEQDQALEDEEYTRAKVEREVVAYLRRRAQMGHMIEKATGANRADEIELGLHRTESAEATRSEPTRAEPPKVSLHDAVSALCREYGRRLTGMSTSPLPELQQEWMRDSSPVPGWSNGMGFDEWYAQRKTSDVAPAAVQKQEGARAAGNDLEAASPSGAAEDQPQPARLGRIEVKDNVMTWTPVDQPQPACPPTEPWVPGPTCDRCRKPTPPRGRDVSPAQAGDFCWCPDPAPEAQRAPAPWVGYSPHMPPEARAKADAEAQRAQSECAHGVRSLRWVCESCERVESEDWGDNIAAKARFFPSTPAPNIAAAVAELAGLVRWGAWVLAPGVAGEAELRSEIDGATDAIRRALAYLQPTTEPPGGDKESER